MLQQGIEEVQAQLDEDDHDDIAEIRSIRLGKRSSESTLCANARKKGPLDVMFMQKPEETIRKKTRQTNINDAADKEARDKTVQYIARFFYTNGIAFNVARSKHFKLMLEAVGNYGPFMKPPSYYELRGPLLDKELASTKEMLLPHVAARVKYGCSIMSDGWTDRKGRTLINFLVNSSVGTMFVDSVDASEYAKTEEKLYELLNSFVDELGERNVVQLITDNGSNYVLAGKMLMQNKRHIFWTPCAAHCIDLMLEDIGKIPKIKKTIQRGCCLTTYISNHTFALSLMRKKTNNVELVRHGVTRFATTFLTLQRLHTLRSKLRGMFLCEEWLSSKSAKELKGKQATACVLVASFWNDVLYTLRCMAPLVDVLRMVHNEKKPAMGEIYAAMANAKVRIEKYFNYVEVNGSSNFIIHCIPLVTPSILSSFLAKLTLRMIPNC